MPPDKLEMSFLHVPTGCELLSRISVKHALYLVEYQCELTHVCARTHTNTYTQKEALV